MPQYTSNDIIPSALVVWVTLAFCLLAWRCNAEDYSNATEKTRQDIRFREIESELTRLKEADKSLERRLERVEQGDFHTRLNMAESKMRMLEVKCR